MTATAYGIPVMTTDPPAAKPPANEVLTLTEAAVILGRSTKYTRELAHSGVLATWIDPTDRNYRALRSDVEAVRDGRAARHPNAMFVELGECHRRLAEHREQARRRERELIATRDRAMVRWSDAGASTTAIAEAAHMGRQRATDILRTTRTYLAATERPD